ncbi:hypothetical protein JG688_00017982 [Phytophthora aleatoria]|uniref:DOT1 domain-containing protein n=1 Tax=Phytophthora aleatoria TaxID=2496075 RepID=A0A8J5IQ28_9STRA|nr:hypothetical protein JG688_00017982 [Phytophthora aleatoria]
MNRLGVVGPGNGVNGTAPGCCPLDRRDVGCAGEDQQGIGRIDHDGDCYSEVCLGGAWLGGAGQDRPGGDGGGPGDTGQYRADVAAGTAQMCTHAEAAQAMVDIFGDIMAKDIRQQAGRTQYNAGEILPAGIAKMLDAIGLVQPTDIVLDVGTGIGNALVQVALSTHVSARIGVEMRKELCELSRARWRRMWCCVRCSVRW